MIRDLASIVLCTYNRAHLLRRSLETFARQTQKRIEVVILDDGSADGTVDLVDTYRDRLQIRYERLSDKKPGEWRDAGAIINRGIRMTRGEFVYITHPEVMIPADAVEKFNTLLRERPAVFVNARTYYLTPGMQAALDSTGWEEDFYRVRTLPRFYDSDEVLFEDLHPDPEYNRTLTTLLNEKSKPRSVETQEAVYSWVFGGMTRAAWKAFGGLNEYAAWGAVDIDFMDRRAAVGIETVSPFDVYVIHQNHDRPEGPYVPTKRDFAALIESLKESYCKPCRFLDDMEM